MGTLTVRPPLTVGSLCSGYGGLDLGILAAWGGRVAWHAEIHPVACRVLARHWPGVPNHGDLHSIDWTQVESVTCVSAGFPCQDVSVAGRRAGLAEGTRSGLWLEVVRALSVLSPPMVVIENVRGILSAPAAARDVELCPWCLGDDPAVPAVRALGTVLGSLADLGYDSRWTCLRASDVGAPHRRDRLFLLGLKRDRHAAQDPDLEPWHERWLPAPGQAQERWPRSDPRRRDRTSAPDAEGQRWSEGLTAPTPRQRRPDAAERRGEPASHSEGERHGNAGQATGLWVPPASVGGCPAALRPDDVLGAPNRWGRYADAIARWERLTRPAPTPTDARRRLSPAFVEWMLGLPHGFVTGTDGASRVGQLTVLGNGVVPQQAAAALRLLSTPWP